jgi:hypothetical protein
MTPYITTLHVTTKMKSSTKSKEKTKIDVGWFLEGGCIHVG